MALFMAVHTTGGAPISRVVEAHLTDGRTRSGYGTSHLRYWVDEAAGKVFCLIEADDFDLASTVHDGTDGLAPSEIHPVSEHHWPPPRVS